MKLVGFQESVYTSEKDGKTYYGKRLYFTFPKDKVEGVATDVLYVSNSNLEGIGLYVGDDYNVYYNKFGKVESISPI